MATEAWTLEKATIGEGDEVANSLAARILQVQAALGGAADGGHIPLFTGAIYYVDAAAADDTEDGLSPATAKKTIGAAITAASAGDAITIKQGTYTETGLDVNKTGLELWFELGAILDPASGDCLTVSGSYCRVTCPGGALRVNNDAGANTGVVVTGNFVYLSEIRVSCGSTGTLGFDVQGTGCDLRRCRCAAPLTAAFKVSGDKNKLEECCTGGEIADTSIGFWITGSCDKARLRWCSSQGHSTAGFQFDTGCTNIVAFGCEGGGGDGHFIDNATLTFLDIQDKDSREQHEHSYPTPDGEGTAGNPVTVQSQINDETGADDTANYYGDVAMIVAPGVITVDWFYKGMNIYATTTADDQRFFSYRVEADVTAARNAGNAWDEGATVLTFDDATGFETGDLIWIRSPGYKPNGEIVEITDVTGNVVTIARQTENSGRTGLHWDHTTNDGGSEVAYLCWRDENEYHSSDFNYSSASAREFRASRWQKPRRMHANDGLIVRMINGTDGNNSQADVAMIWSD